MIVALCGLDKSMKLDISASPSDGWLGVGGEAGAFQLYIESCIE